MPDHTGNIQPQLDLEEHDHTNRAKRVVAAASTATIGSVKLTDGTDTATVASAVDSRNGLDIQHSSVASKQLLFFHSDDASHRLAGGASKDFPTDIPGGSTWFDLDGYAGFSLDWVDNTGGATGCNLYAIWSDDQTVMAEEFPPGSNTQALVTTDSLSNVDNNIHKFVPKQARYVKLRMVNGTNAQGSTIPNIAKLTLNATPTFFTNSVNIASQNHSVVGPSDAATFGLQPVIIGGVDSVSSPTSSIPVLVSATGQASVQGTATAYNGTPIVTVERLGTTGTLVNTSVATASTQVAASSTTRRGFAIHNDSSQVCYLKFGTSASTTSYTVAIQPNENWQMPLPLYSGAITCISAIADAGGVWRTTTW